MTTTMTYTTLAHPRSGELFAAELDDNATVLRAVGPCRTNSEGVACDPETDTPLTREMIHDWIDNAGCDAVDDGAWLEKV